MQRYQRIFYMRNNIPVFWWAGGWYDAKTHEYVAPQPRIVYPSPTGWRAFEVEGDFSYGALVRWADSECLQAKYVVVETDMSSSGLDETLWTVS